MMDNLHFLIKSAPLLLKGALMTVQLAVYSSIISFSLGTLAGIALCQRLRVNVIAPVLDVYVFCVRCIPFYVQLLIVYFVLPNLLGLNLSSFNAGIIALGFCSTGYVAEIVRSGLNVLPAGQWDVCRALGYSRFATLWYVIMPQLFFQILAALVNEFIQIIHATSMLSAIGTFELTKAGVNIIAREMNPMPIYLGVAVLYLVMTGLISTLAKWLERRFSYGVR
jgi:polar amino acid transport system permease protein